MYKRGRLILKLFLFRLFIFISLWVYLIAEYSEQMAYSLLLFAATLSLYFFLSIKRVHIFIYYVLSLLILFHSFWLTTENLISILLVVIVAIIAAFRLRERAFLVYASTMLMVMLLLNILQGERWIEMTAVALCLVMMTVLLNKFIIDRDGQRKMYEGLLSEYRRLKRLNLDTDHNVRLEERTRIARDIHDSVGHRLTSLIMKLEMLAIQERNNQYRELKQMAEEGLNETREAVKTLQSEEHEGIATVIHMIRKLEVESHIIIQFTIKQGVLSVNLSNEKSVVLYRVLQEALTNVMRHAQTREVEMVLGKSALGDVSFEIKNVHYADKPFSFGFGLTNMKERVTEIGGHLNVYQTDKQFIVSGTIPGNNGTI